MSLRNYRRMFDAITKSYQNPGWLKPPEHIPVHFKTKYKNQYHGVTNKYYGIRGKTFPYPPFRDNMLYVKPDDLRKMNLIKYTYPIINVQEGGSNEFVWLFRFLRPGTYDIKIVSEPTDGKDGITEDDINNIRFNIKVE